jgi:hypothetical protein
MTRAPQLHRPSPRMTGVDAMPIPGDSERHFVITVDPDSTFENEGDFD